MNQIQIANVLLTQRCNLKCSYCHIVRDYKGKPSQYPTMEYYTKHELSHIEWLKIFERLKKNNPNIFIILYGGEPFLYNEIIPLIDQMHKMDINYTIITNNTEQVQDIIKRTLDKIGKFKGFTSSVDPVIFQTKTSDHIVKKSLEGFERLVQMKKENLSDDVVAEITCSMSNIDFLHDTVKILSKNGIWASITSVDMKKTSFYDFSSLTDSSYVLNPDVQVVKDQFKLIFDESDKLLVHIPLIIQKLFNILPCNLYCKIYSDIHNVTIAPDGRFRLCLRICGTETQKYKYDQLILSNGNVSDTFNYALEHDYSAYCLGCNWTCMLMSKYFSKQILSHSV